MKIYSRVVCFISSIFFSTVVFAQSTKSVVTGINAVSSSANSVTVSWNLPSDKSSVSSFLIYRDVKPFTSYSQAELLEPSAILRAGETSYTDTLYTQQDFFYAVVSVLSSKKNENPALYFDEQTDSETTYNPDSPVVKSILPGVNATVMGVHTQNAKQKREKPTIQKIESPKKTYSNGELRETPLPYIDVLDEKPAREPSISKESRAKVKSLFGKESTCKREPLDIHIFEEDLISPAGGDEYLLFDILKTYFIKKKYTESISALRKFLAQNRSKAVADRASFYLGESYYYTGNFPAALTRFLALEDSYPELSRQWIDSTLDLFY